MRKAEIELGVEYVAARTGGKERYRFVSLTPPKDPKDYPVHQFDGAIRPAWRIKSGELPAERWVGDRWVPVLARPVDMLRRWDHPDEVASRQRYADRQAKVARARELLRQLGFSVRSGGDRPRLRGEPDDTNASVTRISTGPTPEPLVEIDLDAFLAILSPYAIEHEEALADRLADR